MHNLRALCGVALLALTGAGAALAGPLDLPGQYSRDVDGGPVLIEQPGTGATLAIWSYRGRGEYDLAMARRDASGSWSDVVFLGRNDGLDQVTPAVAADSCGTVYVAYAVRETAQIHLTVVPPGGSEWTPPIPLTPLGQRRFAPALSVIGNRLVAAWRTFSGAIEIRHFPLFVPTAPLGINDGPDGVDPLGAGGGTDGVSSRE